jgi:hypothetical protein
MLWARIAVVLGSALSGHLAGQAGGNLLKVCLGGG